MLVSVASRCLLCAFVAALDQLLPLAGRIGEHQAAAVQHADELLQLLGADRLRREFALEALGDLVEARVAVEHLQDGEFLFLEAVILQADRILHDPVQAALVAMLPGADRAACESAAFATNWKQGFRQGWPFQGMRSIRRYDGTGNESGRGENGRLEEGETQAQNLITVSPSLPFSHSPPLHFTPPGSLPRRRGHRCRGESSSSPLEDGARAIRRVPGDFELQHRPRIFCRRAQSC